MKVSSAIASTALLASTVAAANPRFAEQRAQAVERRNARRSNNFHSTTINKEDTIAQNGKIYTSGRTFSGDRAGGWGGAVVDNQSGVNDVKATFTVPNPSTPANGVSGTKYGGAAWVGIDGYGTGELWQTGITWTIENGTPGFSAWYEWVPGPYTSFSNITISAGDTVTVEVVASSSTSGTAYVTNESTGESVQQFLSGQAGLPQVSAEWIVEDFQSGSEPIPFAGFSPAVTFSDCSYTDSAGSYGVPSGALILEVGQDNNNDFTSCSVSGAANTVTCSRTGATS